MDSMCVNGSCCWKRSRTDLEAVPDPDGSAEEDHVDADGDH